MSELISLSSMNDHIVGIGYTALILGILIFAHEFGHFWVAKKLGVIVEKFSFGFGPKIIGKKIGETEYLISAIPWGGYVKLFGDDPEEKCDQPEKSFLGQTPWKKISIVFAGPLFNFILSIFIFTLIYMTSGMPETNSDTTRIGEVSLQSPAETGGLKKNDVVISIDGKTVNKWDELSQIIRSNPKKNLTFEVKREETQVQLNITPEVQKTKNAQGEEMEIGLIGIIPAAVYARDLNPFTATAKSIKKTGEISVMMINGIKKLIFGEVAANNVGGPILIYMMIKEQAKVGFLGISFFIALMSINLGIINLFPIPILDGGHIFFFTIEAIIGKPLSENMKKVAQQVGFVMLISLMIFAFYNDIIRFFVK